MLPPEMIDSRPLDEPSADASKQSAELVWIDRLKAMALGWIVLNHVIERIFGGAYAGNPQIPWPPLVQRIAQFAPVSAGRLSWPTTVLRDIGWFGDQGVTVFIILSGFGLTWGLLARGTAVQLPLQAFYRRRASRILPLWWGAHILFLTTILLPHGLSTGNWRFYASFAGLRFIPTVFYYFSPAWWYVGLLMQLYLVYPVLWRIFRERGAVVLLSSACLVGFGSLALGPVIFHSDYLDVWQRGGFFITRLPEFSLGIAFAAWWYAAPDQVASRLQRPLSWCLALLVYVLGTALSFTFAGMIVAPFLLGASAVVLFFPFVLWRPKAPGLLARLGRESYPVYLVHHPFILFFVPATFSVVRTSLGIGAALIATAVTAPILVVGTTAATSLLRTLQHVRGTRVAAATFLLVCAAIVCLPIAADVAVVKWDPQEVNGWGERLSLQPSERYGWTLVPSTTTRLRWQSYDYRVKANALGFPGPLFPVAKPSKTVRILVTGDAFSSAEGVDTELAWPRVLETDLQRRDAVRKMQVLNFAITGYGPNEESAVVQSFVPRYRPDILVVEMFANDVEDVLTSDETFRAGIGFGRPSPTGVASILQLAQLQKWLRLRVVDPLVSTVEHQPTPEGYFLGSFRFLERNHPQYDGVGVRLSAQRYEEMAATAARDRTRMIVVFVPPPVAVCGPNSLRYYPAFTDLRNTKRYDLGLPERRARVISAAAHVTLWDLGPALRALPACPYMRHNLHFTAAGNAAVAGEIARRLRVLLPGV